MDILPKQEPNPVASPIAVCGRLGWTVRAPDAERLAAMVTDNLWWCTPTGAVFVAKRN
jgi:hypothetical protein